MTDTDQHLVIEGLTELAGNGEGEGPDISVLARTEGATVIRLSFRAGQVMKDHKAGKPILVVGQLGEVDFTVYDSSDAGATTRLAPGKAIHVDARVTHALSAATDAVLTLLVLTSE